MIYWSRWSVDLRWMIQHRSLDDLVSLSWTELFWKPWKNLVVSLWLERSAKRAPPTPQLPNSQTLEPGRLVTFKQVLWNFHVALQSELNLLKFWLCVNAATFSCPLPAASYLPLPLDQRRVLSTLAWTFDLLHQSKDSDGVLMKSLEVVLCFPDVTIFSHFRNIFRVLSTVELSSRSHGQHLPWMNQPRQAWRSYYTLLITTTTTFENVWIIL